MFLQFIRTRDYNREMIVQSRRFWMPGATVILGASRRFFRGGTSVFLPEPRHDGYTTTRYNTAMSNPMPRIDLKRCLWSLLLVGAYLAAACMPAIAKPADSEKSDLAAPAEPPKLPAPASGKLMPKPHRVWFDVQEKRVLVDGYVSLNEGMLEMFACPKGTKEHESIVAVYSSAQIVHAALLAVGAKVGNPVKWGPKFEPPKGTEIEIEVRWLDANGKWLSLRAQEWVKDLTTNQPMAHAWVFAGSGFWKDDRTGSEHYLAEQGDLICVSNFSSATLDIPVESSQANDGLQFVANTAKIPAIGTPVRLILTPKLELKP